MKSKQPPPPPNKRCQMGAGTEAQCRAARLYDSDYCFFHDPEARRHREELERLEKLPLARASDIHRLLAWTLKAVRKKRINPQQAYAVGWLVRLVVENQPELEKERSAHEKQSYQRLERSEEAGLVPQWEEEPPTGDEPENSS